MQNRQSAFERERKRTAFPVSDWSGNGPPESVSDYPQYFTRFDSVSFAFHTEMTKCGYSSRRFSQWI